MRFSQLDSDDGLTVVLSSSSRKISDTLLQEVKYAGVIFPAPSGPCQ